MPGLYVVPPGADGVLCVTSPQYRYSSVPLGQVFQFDAAGVGQPVIGVGEIVLPTDGSFAPVPAVNVGESRVFQAWHRDGVSSNFSNATSVAF
ncbi:MAG: hypothetical protein GY711_31175 [bacterium]|nr:hypothetical protein [bacterium]